MPPVSTINPINRGRLVNFVTGITGVAAGGQAVVNLPTNLRYHRIILQCTAVNYTGAQSAAAITKITGAGVGGTATTVAVNGVLTSATIQAAGSGYVTGDTVTVYDPTGVGAVLTVTASAGAITALAVTVGGTPSPVSPVTLLSSVKLLVNGINMRDISPDSIIRMIQANGLQPQLGELPLYFTAPWRNVNQQNEVLSWDMFGQSTFQLQLGINATVTNPGIVGIQEFDYMRNVRTLGDGSEVPFLQPVSQHQFSWPMVAGRNDINTLPFSYPISRLWLLGSTPGSITQLEVYQDNNKVFEALQEQFLQVYDEYGFQFGQANWFNQNYSLAATPPAALARQYAAPIYFDCAFISDPDQRPFKALKAVDQFILRVYSSVAQTLTIVQETLPGAYAG